MRTLNPRKRFAVLAIATIFWGIIGVSQLGFAQRLEKGRIRKPPMVQELVRLDGPGGSMEKVEVRNQTDFGICRFTTLAQMIDAWRFTHGDLETDFQTSEMKLALDAVIELELPAEFYLKPWAEYLTSKAPKSRPESESNSNPKSQVPTTGQAPELQVRKDTLTSAGLLRVYFKNGACSLADEQKWLRVNPNTGIGREDAGKALMELLAAFTSARDLEERAGEAVFTSRPFCAKECGGPPAYLTEQPVDPEILKGIPVTIAALKEALKQDTDFKALRALYEQSPCQVKKIGDIPKPKVQTWFFKKDEQYIDFIDRYFNNADPKSTQPLEVSVNNREFNTGQDGIVERHISFFGETYVTQKTENERWHVMLIVGRRVIDGETEYLFLNSYGKDQQSFGEKPGRVWIDAKRAAQSILKVRSLVPQDDD